MNKQPNKISNCLASSSSSAELFSKMYAMGVDELIESLEDLGIRSVRSSEIKQLLIRAAEEELIQRFKSKEPDASPEVVRTMTHKELGMEFSVLKSKVVRIAKSSIPNHKKNKIMQRLLQETIVLRDVQLEERCVQKCRHNKLIASLVELCEKVISKTAQVEIGSKPPILKDVVKEVPSLAANAA